MKEKNNGIAKRDKQDKQKYDEILQANYELGMEYYKEVEEKLKKMNKNRG